jgi:diguanylate cyclase (GGDEF)-like protein
MQREASSCHTMGKIGCQDGLLMDTELYLERLYGLAHLDLLNLDELGSLDKMLQHIVEVANDLVQADKGISIILWDADHETFTQSATTTPSLQPKSFSNDTRSHGGVTRWIVDHLECFEIEDVRDDPFRPGRKMKDHGVGSFLGVPLQSEHQPLGVLFFFNEEPHKYSEQDILFCKLLAFRASIAIVHTRYLAQILKKATRDELTGLLNRVTFFEVAEKMFEEHKRSGQEMTVLFMDVDNFKYINDTFGHLIGDRILHFVGNSISKATRSMDVAARYGGDEFILLCPNTSLEQLEMIKARFKKYIKSANLGIPNDRLEISLGQASSKSIEKLQDLIHKADRNMYHKKRTSKLVNRQGFPKR